uniref:N-sulphoglucosamine sulphohydrolase n=1 Tax=Caligus rogercresseyi TaxID=217165 RepID=C1BME9_CALRO|nr:N-sulphoglucosamine sulphohydrolase precursor [Caligus rogercresseyi]
MLLERSYTCTSSAIYLSPRQTNHPSGKKKNSTGSSISQSSHFVRLSLSQYPPPSVDLQLLTDMTPKSYFYLFVLTLSSVSSKKNVLLMIADDLGMESGIYGNKNIQTPNIDGLGRQSCVFDSAYTPVSSCSPSRSSLLTGYPPHQNGMYGLHNSIHHFSSLKNTLSITKLLARHGYVTGGVQSKDSQISWIDIHEKRQFLLLTELQLPDVNRYLELEALLPPGVKKLNFDK